MSERGNYLFGLLGLLCLGLFLYLFLDEPSGKQEKNPAETEIIDFRDGKPVKQLAKPENKPKVYAGRPQIKGYPNPVKVLERQGFMVGYDEKRKNAAWVAYRVGACKRVCFTGLKRPSSFKTDYETRAMVQHSDYTHSGYDRGHLAPNYAISTRYGEEAQRESFLMSNIVPQKKNLNRYVWRELEMQIADEYAERLEEVWVLTGPIYDEAVPDRFLPNGTEIPDAFFKVMLDELASEPRLMGFVIPQDVNKNAQLKSFLVPVDEVEKQTGLDLFAELDDNLENKLEALAVGF